MNEFTDFIDAFVPKNLSSKRRQQLKLELENHLYDKSDFYKEIGYNAEESVNMAIADFGTDDEMRKSIFNEFEELYSEKSIFGVISFLAILLMNWLCVPLDIWVASADFNDDPSVLGTFISFGMIFAVCILIIFARVKKYRKMLIAVGFANLALAAAN